MNPYLKTLYLLLIALGIASCSTTNESVRKYTGGGWYTVKKSDTLYSIAWRYGLDYRQLVLWNQISADFIIHPGQVLTLVERKDIPPLAKNPEARKSTKKIEPGKQKITSKAAKAGSRPTQWRWPTTGKITSTYAAGKLDRRGIDIEGKLGQTVHAVANGKVVYSGNGLVGYGNLIIIKHNDTYLSAYAHNQQRLVNEGAVVKGGTVISKMGRHPDGTTRLHFEIRKYGKPVDPLRYLPRL